MKISSGRSSRSRRRCKAKLVPEDRPHRDAAAGGIGEEPRRVVVPREREEHPGGRVEARVENAEHGGQDHEVHDIGREGYPHLLESDGKRALEYRVGGELVSHGTSQEEDRAHVEEQIL